MALESATYIDGLVATNPVASDAISSADDHLRLIKSTLKATFPNVTGPVTKTQAEINGLAPLASPAFTGVPTAPTAAPGTNTTQVATTAYVQAATTPAGVLAAVYPVGSIYINATNATNPGTLLGFGTWVAFGAGRVPVGFNSGDTSFNAAEKVGGSKDAIVVSHTHTGSTNSTGAHTHTQVNNGSDSDSHPYGGTYTSGSLYQTSDFTSTAQTQSAGSHSHTVTVDSAGSSGTNANLQPYITVYMWKRTA